MRKKGVDLLFLNPQKNTILTEIIIWGAVFSLFFSVTNLIPLSATMSFLMICFPFLVFQFKYHSKVFKSLIMMLGYFVINVLIYHPESLLQYEFYRRDGNVFITYSPLLLLPLIKTNINLNKIISIFIVFSSFLNLIFLMIFYSTGGTVFIYESGIYHFLFLAHNAAGGFLAILLSFSIGYYFGTKKLKFLILSIANSIGLIATDSRGSILAFIIACAILLLARKVQIKRIVIVLIVSQALMVSWFYTHASPNDFLLKNEYSNNHISYNGIERYDTMLSRELYIWPRAVYLFIHSPIFGTGFGSYNDRPYLLEGADYLFEINKSDNVFYNSAHAHHTFLNVLAETGIVGLLLLINFLVKVRRYITSINNTSIRCSLEIGFWMSIFSSLTEHRLFTPSQMIPFVIILGLTIANNASQENTVSQNIQHEI